MSVGVRRREHSVAITFPSSSRFGCGFGIGSVPMTTSSRTSSRASAASSRQPGRGGWRLRPQLTPAQREAVFRSTGPGGSGGSPSASKRRRSRGSGCRSVIASGRSTASVGRLTYRPVPTTGMLCRRTLRARGHRPAHSAVSCCVDAPSCDPASRPARRLLARRPLPSGFEGSTRQPPTTLERRSRSPSGACWPRWHPLTLRRGQAETASRHLYLSAASHIMTKR